MAGDGAASASNAAAAVADDGEAMAATARRRIASDQRTSLEISLLRSVFTISVLILFHLNLLDLLTYNKTTINVILVLTKYEFN